MICWYKCLVFKASSAQARLLGITSVSWFIVASSFFCVFFFTLFIFVNLYCKYWWYFKLDLSKMDQTWSDLIKLEWIKLDQTWSDLIKLDQNGFLANQKMLLEKVVTLTKRIKNGCFILDFFGSALSKMAQTWSN